MKKDDYKLGKILGTSAIISDVPLGSPKPKRTKLKLIILAVILGYVGFAVYSNSAVAERAFIKGDAAEKIIVTGKQVAYWRTTEDTTRYDKAVIHNYVIHWAKGVYECFHYHQNSGENKEFRVLCVTNVDAD